MYLVMYLNGKRFASQPLAHRHWQNEAYLTHIKLELEEEYASLIEQSDKAPEFFIEGVGSQINHFQPLTAYTDIGAVDTFLDDLLYPSRFKKYKE